MSRQTAIKLIQTMTGVENVDREISQIDEDAEVQADRQQRAFGAALPPLPDLEDEDEDNEADEDEQTSSDAEPKETTP